MLFCQPGWERLRSVAVSREGAIMSLSFLRTPESHREPNGAGEDGNGKHVACGVFPERGCHLDAQSKANPVGTGGLLGDV